MPTGQGMKVAVNDNTAPKSVESYNRGNAQVSASANNNPPAKAKGRSRRHYRAVRKSRRRVRRSRRGTRRR